MYMIAALGSNFSFQLSSVFSHRTDFNCLVLLLFLLQISLLKILLAAAPTSKAKTESINILADVLPEEMP